MKNEHTFSRRTCLRQSLNSLATVTAISGLGASFSVLQGCSSNTSQLNQPIRMGISGQVQMLDPRKATDALSTRINRLLYRQLIDFDGQFLPKPDLASWQQLSATHYRFQLIERPNFSHIHRPVNAQDIFATYQSVLDKTLGSAHRGSLLNIASLQVVNETTIDFYLKQPDALFVGRLVIGIVPKELIEQNHPFHQQPVGCGACQFVEQNPQRLRLQRNTDQQYLDFITVKDATVRVLKLQNQELDLVQNDLSPELVAYCQAQSDLNVDWHSGTNFGYIGFNFQDSLLAMPELRQAIAHGIDRQAVIDAIFKGHVRIGKGLLVPEHWAGVKQLQDYDYSPEKTQHLVDKVIQKCLQDTDLKKLIRYKDSPAGKSSPFIELSYKTSNDPTRIRLATIYQSQLKPLGIHLKIQSYDWGTFYNDIKQGRFQLYSLAWVGVKSPDIFQYVFDSKAIPPKGANRGHFADAVTDELIAAAMQAETIEAQANLYRKLQTRLHQSLAHIPLWYEDHYVVSSQNIQEYQLFADGRYDGILTARRVVLVD